MLNKYHSLILAVLLSPFLFSCTSSEEKDTFAYFGGHIKNPKGDIIIFLKDSKAIDTIRLGIHNTFLKKFKNLEEGLYTFKHGLEFQYVYLEPTDSILIHLNTWDFDENLVFSGRGSEKNEFLVNALLNIENDEKIIGSYYRFEEEEFSTKLDSMLQLREAMLSQFKSSVEDISVGFIHLAEASIKFPFLRRKEAYSYFHKHALKLNDFPTLSEHFYDYRKHVNLNDTALFSFYPYTNYVTNYIYNAGYKKITSHKECQVLATNMLEVIATNITQGDFKDKLLKSVLVNDFLKGNISCSFTDENLKIFLDNCDNIDFRKEIEVLIKESKLIKNNQPLSPFNLVNSANEIISVGEIIKNKPTVLYFWSTEFMSPKYLSMRLSYFKKRFPSISFVGIQINDDFIITNKRLKQHLGAQYKIPKNGLAHSYFSSRYPRSIIINKEGTVINGFAYFNSKFFSPQLERLINN
ncbi:MAG: hypothetical protein COB98_00415 [Flavobacteriaceae bacterium]|nr:MAG: hypothetical protein COB98_00415 [Flavobacteriaceae bacterium]